VSLGQELPSGLLNGRHADPADVEVLADVSVPAVLADVEVLAALVGWSWSTGQGAERLRC